MTSVIKAISVAAMEKVLGRSSRKTMCEGAPLGDQSEQRGAGRTPNPLSSGTKRSLNNSGGTKWTGIGAIANPLSSGTKRNLNKSGGTTRMTWIAAIVLLLAVATVPVQSTVEKGKPGEAWMPKNSLGEYALTQSGRKVRIRRMLEPSDNQYEFLNEKYVCELHICVTNKEPTVSSDIQLDREKTDPLSAVSLQLGKDIWVNDNGEWHKVEVKEHFSFSQENDDGNYVKAAYCMFRQCRIISGTDLRAYNEEHDNYTKWKATNKPEERKYLPPPNPRARVCCCAAKSS